MMTSEFSANPGGSPDGQPTTPSLAGNDTLALLAHTIESRKPGQTASNPDTSYVARLLQQGPEAFLKKIGEEATETVMAAKDIDWAGASPERNARLVGEVADLWFHCLVALAHYRLAPSDVLTELERRAGTSGIEEKSLRKLQQREAGEKPV